MNRREFLRLSAAMGTSLAGGGMFSGCDWGAYLALQGIRIVDPHAHPDQFHSGNPDPAAVDDSSTLENIVGIGMAASSFAAIGDLLYLNSGVPGVGEYVNTNFQLARVQALADAGKVTKVLQASDIPQASGPGVPPGAILSIEGGDPLTSDAEGAAPEGVADRRIDEYLGLGVRIVTLLHYRHNDLGDAQSLRYPDDPTPPHGGLTPLGAHVVSRLQEKGIVVDAAHASARTLADIAGIAKAAKKPIVDSHTGLRPDAGPPPSRRLRSREEMELVADTGGVVCSWPFAWSTDAASRRTFADWAREIVEMKKAIGMKHVGLGTDGGGSIPSLVEGYRGVQDLGWLAVEMSRAGLSDRDIQAFFGGNLLRVLKACIG